MNDRILRYSRGGSWPSWPSDDEPPPPEHLGANLRTVDDAKRWLQHPSNWYESQLFLILWWPHRGPSATPKISADQAKRLRFPVEERMAEEFYRFVIREQFRKQNGLDKDETQVLPVTE